MKSRILAGLILTLVLSACGLGDATPLITDPVPGVNVFPASVTMAVGARDTLLAAVSGVANGAVRTVDWSSADPTIASVSALTPPDRAVVVGLKPGTTTVIAAWHADARVTAVATVTVR